MPRATRTGFAAELAQLRRQAGRLLAKVRSEIRSVEIELARLKESISSLLTLAGPQRRDSERKAGRRTGRPSRINWKRSSNRCPNGSRPAMFARYARYRTSAPRKSSQALPGGSRREA